MAVIDFSKARVTVVGDTMIDRWVFGRIERISPEAPVPVFVHERTEDRPGGAANVAENLRALGASVHLVDPFPGCVVKMRFVAGQQVFRADWDTGSPIGGADADAVAHAAMSVPCDVLVISDYAKGTCTPDLCQRLIAWARWKGVTVVVDPKGRDWRKYDHCDVITPNEREFAQADDGRLLPASAVLVTRGANGMELQRPRHPTLTIPALPVHAVDVTGAGDTVAATLAASLAIGIGLEEAARLANAAASVVVQKLGTATCSIDELRQLVDQREAA